MKICYLYNQKV